VLAGRYGVTLDIGLYVAGLTVRDIRAHLEGVYGLQVSPDLISRVTDAVLDEVL
jgi:putative transposase